MLNRSPLGAATLAAVAVGLSGCAGGTGTAATPTSSPSTTVANTSPTSPAVPTDSRTTSHRRTVAELRVALLEQTDLPSGFAVEPAGGVAGDIGAASSKDPKCAPLVRLSNAKKLTGSTASASVTFSGGQGGPFVDESIDALGSPENVEALQASFRSAVATCSKLIITVPGQGSFTVKIVEVSAPKFGDHTLATRMTAVGGPMDGLEITQVTAGVRDVVVSITFVAPNPEDVDGGTLAAVSKAEALLDGAEAGA